MKKVIITVLAASLAPLVLSSCTNNETADAPDWMINQQQDWLANIENKQAIEFQKGIAKPTANSAKLSSVVKRFEQLTGLKSITLEQIANWDNWQEVSHIGPKNRLDAPVFLPIGDKDYWLFAKYRDGALDMENVNFELDEERKRLGRKKPLRTPKHIKGNIGGNYAEKDPSQTNAEGGIKLGLAGYHAWHSSDMKNWVHHGPVTNYRSRWMTTAEYLNGEFYLYYDNPNDQDPHLIIDKDLTDGSIGEDYGMVFKDPSNGSDNAVIRLEDGRFHFIYEDWSPINARDNAWDSPLAGHAVSNDGINNFKILAPAIDHRTQPTGQFKEHKHPHNKNMMKYEVHSPEQDSYGDWAAIKVGKHIYLFGDYDKAGLEGKEQMKVARFVANSIDEPFEFIGELGQGHPDPTVGFAEGKFYLITQTKHDYISNGPWVGNVKVRVGVDTDNDGAIDDWNSWQTVSEQYQLKTGFSRVVETLPANLDLSTLPAGYGFAFEIDIQQANDSKVLPQIESITVAFK